LIIFLELTVKFSKYKGNRNWGEEIEAGKAEKKEENVPGNQWKENRRKKQRKLARNNIDNKIVTQQCRHKSWLSVGC